MIIALHERENRPDSNENGPVHVLMVEHNIWRLLDGVTDKTKVRDMSAYELLILSCAACCHDLDKALESAHPFPKDERKQNHGKGSGVFIVTERIDLGLEELHATDISEAVSIHDLDGETFKQRIVDFSQARTFPRGTFNHQRVTVLLKAADILHCDSSRVPKRGVAVEKLPEKDKQKHVARSCIRGWKIDGSRILLEATLDTPEKIEAFRKAYGMMKANEWTAVEERLQHFGFPYNLDLDNRTKKHLDQGGPGNTGDSTGTTGSTGSSSSSPCDTIFILCPRCLEEARKSAADPSLVEFFGEVLGDDFIEVLKTKGVLAVLREITGPLEAATGGALNVDKVKSLLACIAPLSVSVDLVTEGRRQLGVDPLKNLYKGGILEISSNADDGADGIIRGALFDRPCAWEDKYTAGDTWPKTKRSVDFCNVPSRGTLEKDRNDDLKQRLFEACRAEDLDTAMEQMNEWLIDGKPLAVLCNKGVIDALGSLGGTLVRQDGTTCEVVDLALFLSKCKKTHAAMRPIISRLSTVTEALNKLQRSS